MDCSLLVNALCYLVGLGEWCGVGNAVFKYANDAVSYSNSFYRGCFWISPFNIPETRKYAFLNVFTMFKGIKSRQMT